MNCAFHSINTAVVQCQNCGRGLCPACDHRIRGFPYCQDCIVSGIGLLQTPSNVGTTNYSTTRVSPFLATIFSLIFPGLGAAYLGKTCKALSHFALFAGLFQMAILTKSAVFVLGFLGMWLFAAVDTWRTAVSGRRDPASLEESLSQKLTGKPLTWGVALVILGIILFLPIPFGIRLFPLLLVGLGVYLLVENFRQPIASETSQNSLGTQTGFQQEQLTAFSNVTEFRPNDFSASAQTQTGSVRPTTRFGNH